MSRIIDRVRARKKLEILNRLDRIAMERDLELQEIRKKNLQDSQARYVELCNQYGADNVIPMPGGYSFIVNPAVETKPWWRFW